MPSTPPSAPAPSPAYSPPAAFALSASLGILKPVFRHDCPQCTFMGTITVSGRPYDAYLHPKHRLGGTIVLRYGDAPSNYWPGPISMLDRLCQPIPDYATQQQTITGEALIACWVREQALKLGLIDAPPAQVLPHPPIVTTTKLRPGLRMLTDDELVDCTSEIGVLSPSALQLKFATVNGLDQPKYQRLLDVERQQQATSPASQQVMQLQQQPLKPKEKP